MVVLLILRVVIKGAIIGKRLTVLVVFLHSYKRYSMRITASLLSPFALNHASLTAAYIRKKNDKAISAQHFNFHPVLTSLFHFCYTLSGGCCSTY